GRVRLGLAVAVAVTIGWVVWRFPVADIVVRLVLWIRSAGTLGFVVFAVAYIGATVALIPGSLLTLGAGFVYGPIVGTLLVSPVSVLAATAAFLLGRTVARGWIARRMSGSARFRTVDEAIGREGLKIVLLLRLSPLFPFTVLNYALGLTSIRPRDYVVASWVGMLPGTILYVYLGSLLTSAGELLSGEPSAGGVATGALYWGGLAATVAVAWLVTRVAGRALRRSLDEDAARAGWTTEAP
ncbi:MAG: TVP38/TMEM64 family protein, partial [Vicinamibacteraceae bacterium]